MNILFLCSSNIFRSQMAEAFFNRFSKEHRAESAALVKPQEKMHALIIRAMKEEGVDISQNKSKKLQEEMLRKADVVVFMNKNLTCFLDSLKPNLKLRAKIEFWDIPDVIAKETDEHLYSEFVKSREIIKEKVSNLLREI